MALPHTSRQVYRPSVPAAPALAVKRSLVRDPKLTIRWSAVAVGSGIALIVSAVLPWIGTGLNPSRALAGITFPEGITVAVLTALVWAAGALMFLDTGRTRTWLRATQSLSFLSFLVVLLFFGLRVLGGVGYDKLAGADAAATFGGVGWGFWLALVSSLISYVACREVGRYVG